MTEFEDQIARAGRRDLRRVGLILSGNDVVLVAASLVSPGEGGEMHASIGDRIVIRGHTSGESDRDCEVLETRGADGVPPYKVRWSDTGHESLFFPGSDASVTHYEHTSA